ncbi:DNA cytosine methyltransferase [Saccharopolyspora sp. NPDC000359]|uniref:DNA cytosine methyltransferase n=1 Tax=Saccharopolyspora sp. NPDC000359 TaxID=3154251 RepID=UPI0033337B6F
MLTLYDEFAGWGGSSWGATRIPGVEAKFAANHKQIAVDVHALNFPRADHYCGDVASTTITRFPRADLFWASPACPPWTNARGVRRDFDRSTQGVLFGETIPDPTASRARALMEEIPRYLAHWVRRGRPVLAGVVENVVQVRAWDQWSRWLGEIRALGYETRVIALNSAHVVGYTGKRVPQSRDRAYVAYWLRSLGRTPDWDKWLRPRAWCPTCEEHVQALQVFKRPRVDMGTYGAQYVYRCPRSTCRHREVEPEVLGAWAAIDWSADPGARIGDRPLRAYKDPVSGKTVQLPLAPATLARIQSGLDRQVTTRRGGVKTAAYPLSQAMPPFSAGGFHHGLVGPPGSHLVVPYYTTGSTARSVAEPLGTLTTKDRFALLGRPAVPVPTVEECTYRMFSAREVGSGMAFPPDYKVLGTATDQVRGFGNAVTPPSSEVQIAALVEAVTGEQLDRYAAAAAAPA